LIFRLIFLNLRVRTLTGQNFIDIPLKKLILICLFFRVYIALGQSGGMNFTAGPYPLFYTGAVTQIIYVDPDLNAALGPVPFDRFFWLRIYNKNSAPAELHFGYQEFKDHASVNTQTGVIWKPLFSRAVTLAASDPNYKAGYSLYEVLVPPLNPRKTYVFTMYTNMSEDQLALLRDAFLLYDDAITAGGHPSDNDIGVLLDPLKLAKKVKADNFPVTVASFRSYYTDNLLPKISIAGLTRVQKGTIILNELHQQINVTTILVPGPPPVVKTVQPYPVLMDYVSINSVSFKQFSVDTRTSNVITVDVGYVMYGFQDKLFGSSTYVGIDYYLRPFDPSIPFSYANYYNKLTFWDRLSFNLGVTLNSVAKPNYRANLFGTNDNLIVGGGYRLNNIFKINFGALAYYKLDPNFLLNNKAINLTPYAGVSLDIRIGTILNSFNKLFAL